MTITLRQALDSASRASQTKRSSSSESRRTESSSNPPTNKWNSQWTVVRIIRSSGVEDKVVIIPRHSAHGTPDIGEAFPYDDAVMPYSRRLVAAAYAIHSLFRDGCVDYAPRRIDLEA